MIIILAAAIGSCRSKKEVIMTPEKDIETVYICIEEIEISIPEENEIIEIPEIILPDPAEELRKKDSIDRAIHIQDSLKFRKSVKKINGGYNGFQDRWERYLRAKDVLKSGE